MSNLALDRIKSQLNSRSDTSPVQIAFDAIQSAVVNSPILLDELRKILMTELGYSNIQKTCDSVPVIHFESIYDFVPWYSANKDNFSIQQRTALDTLEKTRGMIDAGCACKRSSREVMAHQYFEQFWVNNRNTDLLSTIAKITGASRVTVNSYCAYPTTH